MNRNDTQTYQMLTRVADFGTKNVSSFPKTSGAARLLDGLEKGLKTMSEAGGIYVAAKNGNAKRTHSEGSVPRELEELSLAGRAAFAGAAHR